MQKQTRSGLVKPIKKYFGFNIRPLGKGIHFKMAAYAGKVARFEHTTIEGLKGLIDRHVRDAKPKEKMPPFISLSLYNSIMAKEKEERLATSLRVADKQKTLNRLAEERKQRGKSKQQGKVEIKTAITEVEVVDRKRRKREEYEGRMKKMKANGKKGFQRNK